MRSFISLVFVAVSALVFCLAAAGCSSSHGGDDDSGPNYGEDIAGTYTATMTIDVDECSPDNEGQTADWVIDITQSKNLSTAWVNYTTQGPGKQSLLFKGTVYGTVILKAGIETSSISGVDCTKISVQDYNVRIDLDNNTLAGRLSTNIFYMGNGCDSSNIDCYQERTLTSVQ